MKRLSVLIPIIVIIIAIIFTVILVNKTANESVRITNTYQPVNRSHLSHDEYFDDATKYKTPQDITNRCLECHPKSGPEMLKTSHWKWLGDEVEVGKHGKVRIGKRNLINNFCLSIQGNWASCTKCHVGYGWKDESFDFSKQENIDCLICHDGTGTYSKGPMGLPAKDLNLIAVAKGVKFPKRENCSICHSYGGGGLAVKHGDLDSSLENPSEKDDVHMGGKNMLCIDCHKTTEHQLAGKSMAVSVDNKNRIGCTNCHVENLHKDKRINQHLSSVACQTCHIPTYARNIPTKMVWDWSKAGDTSRAEDIHSYQKIKGEFVYQQNVIPDYVWYNLEVERYLAGDKIEEGKITSINTPKGSIHDHTAKIWPFKMHYATQPYDKKNLYLIPPVTSGEGGYWREFDWQKAIGLGAKNFNLEFSGQYGFAQTVMYWPLSHMVSTKEEALKCLDCHGENGRMNWKNLGYLGDPAQVGGRKK